MKRFFFIFLLLIFQFSWAEKEKLIKVSIPSPREKIKELMDKGLYIYEVGSDYLIGAIGEDKFSDFAKSYPTEVLISDMGEYHARQAPGVNFGRFHSYQEIVDTFNIIALNNPNLVRLDTIGRSVQNRVLLAMKITDNAGVDEHEPRILWDATTHGNENIGTEVCLYLVRHLLLNYGVDPLITNLVNTREIWIIPIVNPDGMVARSRGNANGVDLNRDYGYLWDTGWGSPAPFSQPEILAIRNFTQRAPFVIYTTYHSGTEAAMWPWGYSTNAPYDSIFMAFLCQRYSSYTGYPAFQICRGLYETHGCS
ncbi:MAG: M14 family zinc carboxypeptidase, partial [candidate division WOR-3 bacterium]